MTPEYALDSALLLPQGPSHKVSVPILPTGHRKSKGCVCTCMCGGGWGVGRRWEGNRDPWKAEAQTFSLPAG